MGTPFNPPQLLLCVDELPNSPEVCSALDLTFGVIDSLVDLLYSRMGDMCCLSPLIGLSPADKSQVMMIGRMSSPACGEKRGILAGPLAQPARP